MITRRVWLAGLSGSLLSAAGGGDWKNAAFPNWNDAAVLRLLVDSPWAHLRTIKMMWYGKKEANSHITYKDVPGTQPGLPSSTQPGGSPVGGIGTGKIRNKLPDTADLIFRWSSALPVRQAKALYRLREQKGELAKVSEMVEARAGSSYALEIFGIPTVAAHAGTEAVSALLTRSAAIRTKGGRTIRAERTTTELAGDVLVSTISFPREEPLTVEDKEIEVMGDVQVFEFSERFRLKDMKYLDGLEL
jgi:hypothetical protein